MKSWIVMMVAACGGKGAIEPGVASGSSNAQPRLSVIDAAVAPAKPLAPPYTIEAPPGGKIVRIAVTAANDAALTVDAANEVRLWPALDGTKAPVAVELPPATSLALARSGADYVALLGVVGGSLVVRLDQTGKRIDVVELAPIDGVAAIDGGFVTWTGKHLTWLDLTGNVTRTSDTAPRPAVPAPRVTTKDSDLVISGPDGPRYLGYAFPLLAAPNGTDPHHLIVPGPPNRFLVVTSDLSVVGELSPWTPNGEIATAMTWVGDRDWLVDVPSGVVVWTEGATTGTLVIPKVKVVGAVVESHLVLLSSTRRAAAGRQLARYVPSRHALDPIAFTGWGNAATTDAHLIPPSKNHGALLVLTELERDTQGVAHGHARWVHDIDRPEQGATRWTGDEAWPLAVTGAGTLIVDHHGEHWSAVVDGQPQFELPTDVALSYDGTHVLMRTEAGRIELVKRGADVVWSIPMPGHDAPWKSTLVWADADHVWLVQPHGIATVAPATGAVERAVSGWGFELSRAAHPTSTLGRPLAVALATDRDPPVALAADTRFQTLARDVAANSSTNVLWWGPVELEGAVHRVAYLQSPNIDGTPLFAYLVEIKPAAVVAITAQMWGFPEFQGPFDGADPAWGTIQLPDASGAQPTLGAAPLALHSKWIHGSYEHITFTLARGTFVVVSDAWMERENTGNSAPGKRYATTSDSTSWVSARRPKLATYKGHAVRFVVAAPSNSAAELASGIHKLDIDP